MLSLTSARQSCIFFFDDKVAAVGAANANAEPPHFTPALDGCVMNEILPITPADVVELIYALPDNHSATDPFPTWLLKRSADVLAPFSASFVTCHFSTVASRRVSRPLV